MEIDQNKAYGSHIPFRGNQSSMNLMYGEPITIINIILGTLMRLMQDNMILKEVTITDTLR